MQQSVKQRRINYTNPPNFRLHSIQSQSSVHLATPNVDDSEDEKEGKDSMNMNENGNGNENDATLHRQKSNKDAGSPAMDTLDILDLDKSLSIHSSPELSHGHRHRSLSDSDMPHPEDSPQSTHSDVSSTHHRKSKLKGTGWLSIFQFKAKYQASKQYRIYGLKRFNLMHLCHFYFDTRVSTF